MWLDRGELDKILERSAQERAEPAPQVAPAATATPVGERHDERDRRNPEKRRKRSFLKDLFD